MPFSDYVRQKLQNALTAQGVNQGWEAQRATSTTEALALDILPNSLPYAVTAVTHEAADLPVAEQASVRIRLHKGARAADPVVLDKTLPLADAINARLTLSYGPASVEDHRVALLYGGMDAVPLYLIGLRGQQVRAIAQCRAAQCLECPPNAHAPCGAGGRERDDEQKPRGR